MQKCTTFGVLNAANATLGDDACTRALVIKVTTTNINPVSVAAAEPMMTKKFCQVVSSDTAASCTMDAPFDVHAHVIIIKLALHPITSLSSEEAYEPIILAKGNDPGAYLSNALSV